MEQKSLKGTKTEHNLLASFAGESQARSRYTLFAEKAKEEGYEQIAAIFLETAEQELSHARMFFSLLEGGIVEVNAGYPAGVIGDTAHNLAAAAAGGRSKRTSGTSGTDTVLGGDQIEHGGEGRILGGDYDGELVFGAHLDVVAVQRLDSLAGSDVLEICYVLGCGAR